MPITNLTSSETGPTKVFMPNSLRLICVAASAPHISFFVNGCGPHLNEVTESRTDRVTPSSPGVRPLCLGTCHTMATKSVTQACPDVG